jgi:hypothetical protein
MTTHELKCRPAFYGRIASGDKRFEIRWNDRAYARDDFLVLREYLPDTKEYTGEVLKVLVLNVEPLTAIGIPGAWVAMEIRLISLESGVSSGDSKTP